MTHVLREEAPNSHGLTPDRETFAYFQADVLGVLWNQAQPTLQGMRRAGYEVHPMWTGDEND